MSRLALDHSEVASRKSNINPYETQIPSHAVVPSSCTLPRRHADARRRFASEILWRLQATFCAEPISRDAALHSSWRKDTKQEPEFLPRRLEAKVEGDAALARQLCAPPEI
jgi:hypothetical protein